MIVIVGFKSNCPLVGPGTTDGVPSTGIFLRDPNLIRIYASFGENHRKFRTARSTSATGFEPGTSRLPVLSVTATGGANEEVKYPGVWFNHKNI